MYYTLIHYYVYEFITTCINSKLHAIQSLQGETISLLVTGD